MRSLAIAPLFALAACSSAGHDAGNAAAYDPDQAAARAQRDIANYAAATPEPEPAASPASIATPAPSPTAAAASPADDGTVSAVDLVRRYYDLIVAKKYEQARALWRDDGAASGMGAPAFAASFDKYADYRADVGAPGAVDAGAGQRYVSVPVTIAGTLKTGRRFALAGDLVLHKVAEGIETPDAADHEWRISQSSIKPRPADAVPPTGKDRPAR